MQKQAYLAFNPARRQLLTSAAMLPLAMSATTILAAGDNAVPAHQHTAQTADLALISSALDCVKTGELCADHCIEQLKTGDTALAECLDRVNELVTACQALARLGSQQSRHVVAFAAVTAQVCRDCEKECLRHAEHHQQCADCAKSCAECIRECDKLVA